MLLSCTIKNGKDDKLYVALFYYNKKKLLNNKIPLYSKENCIQYPTLRTSLVVQWLRLCLSKHGGRVQSLIRELRSHMPKAENQNINRNNIVINSVKTFKKSYDKP